MSTLSVPSAVGRMGKAARFIPNEGMDVRNISFGQESSVCSVHGLRLGEILTIGAAAGSSKLDEPLPPLGD